jgi:Na+-translocating ferredoxin:NAD+ oxidoreductase RnfE subunit
MRTCMTLQDSILVLIICIQVKRTRMILEHRTYQNYVQSGQVVLGIVTVCTRSTPFAFKSDQKRSALGSQARLKESCIPD